MFDLSNKIEIMPFVNLYKNALTNTDDVLKAIQESEESPKSPLIINWEPWYELGTRAVFADRQITSEDDSTQYSAQKNALDSIHNCVMNGYEDYIKEWSSVEVIEKHQNAKEFWHDWKNVFGDYVTHWDDFKSFNYQDGGEDDWQGSTLEILKHRSNNTDKLAIGYHLDAFSSRESNGPKAIITSTIYLNDDYENGEISFLNEFDNVILKYKPSKGDLIIFPSDKPFFHGAYPASGPNKYLMRHFLLWNYGGTERYNENKKLFGEEQWQIMQDYIRESEDQMGFYQKNIYMPGEDVFTKEPANGIPFFVKRCVDWNKENE